MKTRRCRKLNNNNIHIYIVFQCAVSLSHKYLFSANCCQKGNQMFTTPSPRCTVGVKLASLLNSRVESFISTLPAEERSLICRRGGCRSRFVCLFMLKSKSLIAQLSNWIYCQVWYNGE